MIILAYHLVSNNIESTFAVTRENFIKQIQWFKNNDYKFVDLNNINENLHNKNNKRLVGIIFDDGYKNTVVDVLPILKDFDVNASMAVSSGLLLKKVRYEIIPHKIAELADMKLVDQWLNSNMHICGHTYSHAKLDILSKSKQNWQIIYDKKILEENFGIEIYNFVYPYGRWNKECIDVIKDNYVAAFATDKGYVPTWMHRYCIKRIEIPRDLNMKKFIEKMEGETI